MKRLGRLICWAIGVCRITRKPVWNRSEFIGWRDECERCGESQFVGRWRP